MSIRKRLVLVVKNIMMSSHAKAFEEQKVYVR